MQDYFYHLADQLVTHLQGEEILLCNFRAEDSDFVRLNCNRVRQAGHVAQRSLSIDLIEGQKHASGRCDLQGDLERDLVETVAVVANLRAQRQHLPDDPYLEYAKQPHSSARVRGADLPDSADAVRALMRAAGGMDLVGSWASGSIYTGFASSLGQRNWHASASFNLDWSCYHEKDKAVKGSYAGSNWEPEQLGRRIDSARRQLEVLARPALTIVPGRYRVYLAPAALREIMDMMAWSGYGLKSHRTARTPLIKMVREGRTLHSDVSISEHHGRGMEPEFGSLGFIKPERVTLIEAGRYRDCLVSPRSAKEYGARVNSGSEYPNSLDMAAGPLAGADVLARLDTGLYVNNLWYCNFSDHNDCRITGMSRFACLWVEGGRVRGPVNVMRFDESLYLLLGDRLLGLTAERELILDNATYGHRSARSYLLPGALIDQFTFTL